MSIDYTVQTLQRHTLIKTLFIRSTYINNEPSVYEQLLVIHTVFIPLCNSLTCIDRLLSS